MSIFGRRVLRVRLCQDAPAWIFPTVEVAASALRAHGLRAIVDHVPAGYRDRTNLSWTEDQEVAEVLKLFAGGDADDPLAEEMAAAWSLAFYTMHRFFTWLLKATVDDGQKCSDATTSRCLRPRGLTTSAAACR
jgi:hypothetical protein